MIRAEVVWLPTELKPQQVAGRTVVVFDVLRATTTMLAALAHGVERIRIYRDIESVRQARADYPGALLCGERNCLRPEGFDLGNSPGAFDASHADQTLLMATTNGTRAILAAGGAERVLIGALVNAGAAAGRVRQVGLDVTLLCAGTDGEVAMEDVIGAGAVLAALGEVRIESDRARMTQRVFESARHDLPGALREARGGQNVIAAGLEADVAFAARLDVLEVVGQVTGEPPVVDKG